jgi:hypothetical protein
MRFLLQPAAWYECGVVDEIFTQRKKPPIIQFYLWFSSKLFKATKPTKQANQKPFDLYYKILIGKTT